MATRVRSFSKINLGLAIGATRPDGFHALATLYQTLAAHDLLTVTAEPLTAGSASRIVLASNDRRVPVDGRNTVWKMLTRVLALPPFSSRGWAVRVEIDKRLPVQGGLGGGSANAAAALSALERETGLALSGAERLRVAAEVGSDVPLFLLGGAVLGLGRGEQVYPMPDLVAAGSAVEVVVALPEVGVSTPQAFRDWDALAAAEPAGALAEDLTGHGPGVEGAGARASRPGGALTAEASSRRLEELSRALAAALCGSPTSSGVFPFVDGEDLARHPLPALVRTGIRNDFEAVVFRQHPLLGTIQRVLAGEARDPGQSALYAALSGSGSALFGLYADAAAAGAAEGRLREMGVRSMRTRLLTRAAYWREMLLEDSPA